MAGKAAGELSAARSDLSELRKRLSAGMGPRHTSPFLRRRLPYPVVEDYRKANPSLEEKPLWCECCGQALRMDQKKYCSRACYLSAMEETHRRQVCAWCGEKFSVCAGGGRTPVLLSELCQRCAECAKEFSQRHPQDSEYRTGKLDRAYQAGRAGSGTGPRQQARQACMRKNQHVRRD